MAQINRRYSTQVFIDDLAIGGGAPIRIQSMTNTNTEDVKETVAQVQALAEAGSELVRITVNTEAAAKSVEEIKKQLLDKGCLVPLVGDFHYNGHRLLKEYPNCAKALSKYRINPGNVGFGKKQDTQFSQMVEVAIEYNKPIRIGVNWGSLDQSMLAQCMDENAKRKIPKEASDVMKEALILSCLKSAELAETLGLAHDKIILSCKVSAVQDLIDLYRDLASRCDYPLHLGLTEAGMKTKGIISTSVAFGVLLQEGIGDTIRASLTPEPSGDRTLEVKVCQEILQALELRAFSPVVIACPGCGRTSSTYFQELANKIQSYLAQKMPEWKKDYLGVEHLKVAVMGCIVNGPGESKHANIGISLPGNGEDPIAPIFIEGKKAMTLRGEHIAEEFQLILDKYIKEKYGGIF